MNSLFEAVDKQEIFTLDEKEVSNTESKVIGNQTKFKGVLYPEYREECRRHWYSPEDGDFQDFVNCIIKIMGEDRFHQIIDMDKETFINSIDRKNARKYVNMLEEFLNQEEIEKVESKFIYE